MAVRLKTHQHRNWRNQNPGNIAGYAFRWWVSKRLKNDWLIWRLCWCMKIIRYIFFMFVLRCTKKYSWLNQMGITLIYKSRIFEFKTSARYICAHHPTGTQKIDFVVGNLEIDSQADTTVAGKDCTVLAYTDQKCNVALYSNVYDLLWVCLLYIRRLDILQHMGVILSLLLTRPYICRISHIH